MKRKALALRPLANPLESKLLLSVAATPWAVRGAPAETAPVFAPRNQPVNTLKGEYSGVGNLRMLDLPLKATVDATGWVKGLGHVRLHGPLVLGGYRPIENTLNGFVTLSNVRGKINVRLDRLGGNEQLPGSTFNVTATVVSGTGAYENDRRIGTATLTLGPDTIDDRSISFTNPIGGTLTIELDLKPPIR